MSFHFTPNTRAGDSKNKLLVHYKDLAGVRCVRAVPDEIEGGKLVVANSLPHPKWAKLPVEALCAWLIARVVARNRSPGYVKNVTVRLEKHFAGRFAARPLESILGSELNDFHFQLRTKMSAPTAAAVCWTVKQLYRELAEEEVLALPILPDKAFATMARVFRRRQLEYPQQEEAERLMGAKDGCDRMIAQLALEAALREDEICAFATGWVSNGQIHVAGVRLRDGGVASPHNAARQRKVDVSERLAQTFALLTHLDPDMPALQQMLRKNERMDHHTVPRRIRALQRAKGVVDENGKPKFSVLQLRHYRIIEWLQDPDRDVELNMGQAGFANPIALQFNYFSHLFDAEDVALVDEMADDTEAWLAEPDSDDAV